MQARGVVNIRRGPSPNRCDRRKKQVIWWFSATQWFTADTVVPPAEYTPEWVVNFCTFVSAIADSAPE